MELALFEQFLPDAEAVRDKGINCAYQDWLAPDGEVYKRICQTDIPSLRQGIERVMGPVDMLGMGFRLNYRGELPNNAIHSDLGWGTHALVLYLHEGPSGTAFWTHRATGTNKIHSGQIDLFEKIKNDWNDESAWEMRNYVESKFNRAIIYESKYFHSRYPFEAYGSDPTTGRLIAVAFFTPRKDYENSSRY